MYVKVRALKDLDSGATQGEQGRRSSRKKKEREREREREREKVKVKVKVKENRKKKKAKTRWWTNLTCGRANKRERS